MNFLKALQGGPGMVDLLSSTLAGLPDDVRRPAEELLEVLTGAPTFGPEDPPAWALAMFDRTAQETGLSSELLSAVAWAMSRFDPAYHPRMPRVGLMGIPRNILADPTAVTAPLEDVAGQDPHTLPGWVPVLTNVRGAAHYIARTRGTAPGGLLEAVAGYAGPDALPRVLGAYVLFLGRRAAAARAQTQELLNGD